MCPQQVGVGLDFQLVVGGENAGDPAPLDELDRHVFEAARAAVDLDGVGDGVDVDHQGRRTPSRSAAATEDTRARSPTYTRSTSATASVMSPASTTPPSSRRSRRSIRAMSFCRVVAGGGDPRRGWEVVAPTRLASVPVMAPPWPMGTRSCKAATGLSAQTESRLRATAPATNPQPAEARARARG